MNFVRLALALLLGGIAAVPTATRAAESYDSCAGFIDSLPAVITTQGTWCLRKDLATGMTTGAAIEIKANNVTIDCNRFKIGGLAAGDGSNTLGVYAWDRENVTVRHCNLRGFYSGVYIRKGGGHMIEDNRVDNALSFGLFMVGDFLTSGTVRNNQVFATGGAPLHATVAGIAATADIIDNTVDGVFTSATDGSPIGIDEMGSGTEVRGNRVRGLVVSGTGTAIGLRMMAPGIIAADNRFTSQTFLPGVAIHGAEYAVCQGNISSRYQGLMQACQDAGGNVAN